MKVAAYFCSAMLVVGVVLNFTGVDGLFVFPHARGPLGKLVTAKQASELGGFYEALAVIVGRQDVIATTGDFRACQKLAVDILQATDKSLVNLNHLNAPIEARIVNSIGVNGEIPDQQLTSQMRDKLYLTLKTISDDF